MTPRRDTYHDYVFDDELGNQWEAYNAVLAWVNDLLNRSGSLQVTNGIVYKHRDYQHMGVRLEVRFDSAGWTGR